MLVLIPLLSIVIGAAYATTATGRLAVDARHQIYVQRQNDSPYDHQRTPSVIPGNAMALLQVDSREQSIDMQRVDLELSATNEVIFSKVIMRGNVLQDLGPKPRLHYPIYQNGTRLLTRRLDICHSLSQAPVAPGWLDLKQQHTTLKEALHQGPFELMMWNNVLGSMVSPGWYTIKVQIRSSLEDTVSHVKITRWLDGRRTSNLQDPMYGRDEAKDHQALVTSDTNKYDL